MSEQEKKQEQEQDQNQEQEQEQDSSDTERWLPGSEEFPSEEDIDSEIETVGTEDSISPFDPDFILFALPFALFTDLILAILEIVALFIAPVKIASAVVNIIACFIFGAWMLWRMGRIVKNKKDYVNNLRNNLQKGVKHLSKQKKIGNVSPKVFERYMRLYAKQMGKVGRATAKVAAKPLGKVLIRGAISFIGVFIFVLGLIPFWTITVIFSLREK